MAQALASPTCFSVGQWLQIKYFARAWQQMSQPLLGIYSLRFHQKDELSHGCQDMKWNENVVWSRSGLKNSEKPIKLEECLFSAHCWLILSLRIYFKYMAFPWNVPLRDFWLMLKCGWKTVYLILIRGFVVLINVKYRDSPIEMTNLYVRNQQ